MSNVSSSTRISVMSCCLSESDAQHTQHHNIQHTHLALCQFDQSCQVLFKVSKLKHQVHCHWLMAIHTHRCWNEENERVKY